MVRALMRWITLALVAGCTSGPELSVVEQSTTACGGTDVVHGMDVSSYETSIDWPTAKAAGIDFAFIRATDGVQFHDPKFATYWAGAKDAGVIRGAYQFFRPTEDPIAQADLLLSLIGPLAPGDLPPALDVETTGGLSQPVVEAAVRAWIDHVTPIIGRPPVIYAGYYSWQDYTGNANLTSSPLWHAQYTSAACPNIPTPWTAWTFWQYSSTGTVPAVLGETTDLDVFDGTLAQLQAFADHAPSPCGTIGATGGEVDDTDACFAAGGPASTLRHVTDAGERASLTWTKATAAALPGNFAQWTLDVVEPGTYRVEVYTAAAYAQAHHAPYRVRASGETREVAIDQTAVDGWQSLGERAFAAGGDQFVQLDDNIGEPGVQLVFDAVRLVRTDAPPDPPPDDMPPGAPQGGGCAVGGDAGLALGLLALRRRRHRTTNG